MGIDIYHYIDGGPCSKQDEIKNIIDKSGVPYTSIVQREENYGVGRNLIGARRDLFDVHGYERVILIEDDLIPGQILFKPRFQLLIGHEITTISVWFKFGIYHIVPYLNVTSMSSFQPMSTSTHTALMLKYGTKSKTRSMNTNAST